MVKEMRKKKINERKKKDMNYFLGWLIVLMVFINILLYSVKTTQLVGAVMSVFVILFSFVMCMYYLGIIERERLRVNRNLRG